MFSRKTIEAYLFFLLRHRLAASLVVAAATVVLAAFMVARMHIFTNFFDLYPPNHPYIKLYTQYRSMFGTANTLLLVVEVKNGTIFDDPATVQKVDRITVALLHDIPGVNGEQVFAITHPKIKTTLTAGSGIKVVPLMYPRVPENKDDLDFLKLKVYTTEGVKGLFVSDDDKATLIVAGFWEEYFDLPTMWAKIQEIVRQEEDANTKISVSGFPILYAYFLEIMPKMVGVLAASIVMILLILWIEFRSWQGVAIPAFSGTLSAVWGLGFGGLCNWLSQYVSWMPALSLDPLVLVIPLLISARAHSHSVQSMERYHEEYHRLRDRDQAIVKSYAEIYAPAMVSILADGLAILTLLVARIPIIQKLAILCSFWIISIFISLVTLHPIILSFTPPPAEEHISGRTPLERFMSWMMVVAIAWLFWLYDYIPGWPVAAMLGIALLGVSRDLSTPTRVKIAGGVVAVAALLPAIFGHPQFSAVALLSLAYAAGLFVLGPYAVLAAAGGGWICTHALGWPVVEDWKVLLQGGVAVAVLLGAYGPVGFGISRFTDSFGAIFGRLYLAIENGLIWLASGSRRPAMAVGLVALLSFGLYFQHQLKVGDTTPGAALLYPKHPYNIAFSKVNEKFLGASQLVIIAEGNAYCTVKGEPCQGADCKRCFPEQEEQCGAEKCVQREGAIENAATLNELDLFARYMAERPEVGGTVTATPPPGHAGRRDGPLLRHRLHECDHRGLLQGLHPRDDRALDRARQGVHRRARGGGRQRPLPARGRADRHPRGGERGGGLVLPREPGPHPRRRLRPILRHLRLVPGSAHRHAAVAGRAAALRGGHVPLRHRHEHQLAAGGRGRHRHRDRLRLLRALAHRRGAVRGRGLRRGHPPHVRDHREDGALHRRVAHREHHLLGVLPHEVPSRHGAPAGAAARLPPDGRAHVHPADGLALQAALRV